MEDGTDLKVEKIKVVQVGCGAMGKGWIEQSQQVPEIEIVGLVDMHRPTAQAAAGRFGLPSSVVFDTLAQAVVTTGAKMVIDVTVPSAHEAVVSEALAWGCHVLGEKPMTETMAGAARMVQAADRAGRTYAVCQNYRYEPSLRSLKSVVDAGTIGTVTEIHADFFIAAHFNGFREQMDYPLILDMAIHTFDAARFLTGADPVSVYCHSFNPVQSWYRGDASAIVIFEMTGGLVFSYRGSWCAEGLHTPWSADWRVVGSKGTAKWDGDPVIAVQAVKPDSPMGFHFQHESLDVPISPRPLIGHAAVMKEFVTALQQHRRPETDCHDNIKSLAMVLAAVQSAKSGKKEPVSIPL